MHGKNLVLAMAAMLVLAGCSSLSEREQVDYKKGAIPAAILEVPPTLTAPETEQRYSIPGKNGEKVASYSEYTKQKAEQPCEAPIATPAKAAAAAPVPVVAPAASPIFKMIEPNGVKSILVSEPFDRAWRRVGLVLDHLRIPPTDKDRSKGIYFISTSKDKDGKAQPDNQILVRDNGESCEVSILDAGGKSNESTARLTDMLYQNLDKTKGGEESKPPRGDAVRRSR
jgi:outer membrane protein assembly factor BamC